MDAGSILPMQHELHRSEGTAERIRARMRILGLENERTPVAYHVECNDVFERYLPIIVLFHEMFVYNLRAAASWKAEYERVRCRRPEGVDSVWKCHLAAV
jgi:hypothetical protein